MRANFARRWSSALPSFPAFIPVFAFASASLGDPVVYSLLGEPPDFSRYRVNERCNFLHQKSKRRLIIGDKKEIEPAALGRDPGGKR
jgi:hypothetical protein